MPLQIAVPIVKPKGVAEIEKAMRSHNISFSERGTKTEKTIKPGEFGAFITAYKNVVKHNIVECEAENGDASELKAMLLEMDLWQTQSREEKRSLRMASATKGNAMELFVVAFQEIPDGSTEFLTVNYTKTISVEERARYADAGAGTQCLKALCSFGIWNLVNHVQDEKARESERGMIRKLKQEQMAKYLLAAAYKPALEADGIVLDIVDEA